MTNTLAVEVAFDGLTLLGDPNLLVGIFVHDVGPANYMTFRDEMEPQLRWGRAE